MIFCAYLGESHNLPFWQEVIHQHAAWLGLGLVSHIESRCLNDGRSFAFGWLRPNSSDIVNVCLQETKEYLVLNTSDGIVYEKDMVTAEQPWQRLLENVDTNIIQVAISLQSGELRIVVPPATPEQFYWTQDQRGFVLGNDMRLLTRWAGMELDERAIYALFRYLMIPPPLTISKNVQRIPNGHMFKLAPNSSEPVVEAFFQPTRALQEGRDMSNPEQAVQETLDGILRVYPETPFAPAGPWSSGGLGSALSRFSDRH